MYNVPTTCHLAASGETFISIALRSAEALSSGAKPLARLERDMVEVSRAED
jgi:hypothetical protein